MPGSAKQNSMFKKTKGYVQQGNPFAVTSCGRRRNDRSPIFAKAEPRRTIGKGNNFNPVATDKSATGGAAGGGMTEKGVREYKRKNPGSKLQTAVTTKPSKLKAGSKDANRRKSFCARSKGWTGKRGKAARARWKC